MKHKVSHWLIKNLSNLQTLLLTMELNVYSNKPNDKFITSVCFYSGALSWSVTKFDRITLFNPETYEKIIIIKSVMQNSSPLYFDNCIADS